MPLLLGSPVEYEVSVPYSRVCLAESYTSARVAQDTVALLLAELLGLLLPCYCLLKVVSVVEEVA